MSAGSASTLVVASARLAAALRRAMARNTSASVWRAPELFNLERWLERLSLDARLAGHPAFAEGFVLSHAQTHALWLEIIGRDRTLHPRQQEMFAARAREAYAVIAEWELAPALRGLAGGLPAFDALLGWQQRFRARCRELAALAVPDLQLAAVAAGLRDPAARFIGFGRPGPVARALGIPAPDMLAPDAPHGLRACATREEEYRAACAWAHAARARGFGTVAVVLPDAASIEACAIVALRERALQDDTPLPFAGGSAGSLASAPMVVTALQLLELARGLAPLEAAALVQSPYLAGHAAEAGQRARLAAELLAIRSELWPGEALLARASVRCPRLAARLRAVLVVTAQSPRRQTLNAWMQQAQQCVAAAGWPGEQPLSAFERAAKDGLGRALDLAASLDAVCAPATAEEARSALRRTLREQRFGLPVAVDAIELLTLQEAAALGPDAAWVVGMNEGVFPRVQAGNPLLPMRPLLEAGVPGANGALDAVFDLGCLAQLAARARELVLSCARLDGETALRPAPGFVLDRAPESPAPATPAGAALMPGDDFEPMPAPLEVPLAPDRAARIPGGARLLADQAACPFRAFAAHRLHASGPTLASPGPDARERGTLLHEALAAFWQAVGSQARLKALDETGRAAAMAAAVETALASMPLLAPRLAGLERERLQGLLETWLEKELERDDFTVLETESERSLELGGLRFRVRIDRIDQLADGRLAVVDYKSGRVSASDWRLPRPRAPQLPLYALAEHPAAVAGIAFASLRRQQMTWVTAPRKLLQSPAAEPDAGETLQVWRHALSGLAAEIVAGVARVAPSEGRKTCQHCEFTALCRIHDAPPLPEEDEDADEPA